MDTADIRHQLERECGGAFTEHGWKVFNRLGSVDQFREGELEWTEFQDLAKEFLAWQQEVREEAKREHDTGSPMLLGQSNKRAAETEGGEKQKPEPPELSAEEKLRAEVFEEYLAKVCVADYYVNRFCRRVLDGRLLSAEQAHKIIRSPAMQAFPPTWFKARHIALEEHDAELLEYESGVQEGNLTVDYATIFVRWPDNPHGITERVSSSVHREGRFRMLTFANEEREAETIPVWRDSVLGELQELVSQQIVRRFPWQEAQATWFVLTGDVPAVPPVRMGYRSQRAKVMRRLDEPVRFGHSMITMSAASWVPAATVRKVHRDLQWRALEERENRQPEIRALKLLRFVIEQENPLELTKRRRNQVGKQLVDAWDRENPHWAYGSRYRQPTSAFWRDYNRVENLVMHPS